LGSWVIFLGLNGLEEGFAEIADLLASKEGFLRWEDIPDEGFIGLLAFLVGEIAQEEIVIEVVQLVTLGL
jgi:hypothetical protein